MNELGVHDWLKQIDLYVFPMIVVDVLLSYQDTTRNMEA